MAHQSHPTNAKRPDDVTSALAIYQEREARRKAPLSFGIESHLRPDEMPKAKRKRKKHSSCPKGWVPAGAVVPVRLTKKQEEYRH